MKTLYLLAKEIESGVEEFFEKHDLVPLYFIVLLLAYISAFMLICMGWYAYELITFGHLNGSEEDTYTALKWSLFVMLPIADFYLKIVNEKLDK